MLQQVKHPGIGDLRDFVVGDPRILLRHDVFIIDQARGVIQQLADGDCVSVSREVRKDVREMVLVAQLAIVNQQHDRHGGELLANRSQAKVRFRTDLLQGSQVGYAIAFSEYRPAFLDYEHRATGIVHGDEFRKQAVDGRGGNLGERGARPRKHRHSYREAADRDADALHALASCSATSGSPAACHASNPPATLTTLRCPARSSKLHATMLRYPLLQWTATGRS